MPYTNLEVFVLCEYINTTFTLAHAVGILYFFFLLELFKLIQTFFFGARACMINCQQLLLGKTDLDDVTTDMTTATI